MTIKDQSLEPYYIEASGGGFEVIKSLPGSDPKGNIREYTFGFFTTITAALNTVIESKLGMSDDVVTLREYLELKEALYDKIRDDFKL